MANTINPNLVADVTRDILVRPLTGKIYNAINPAPYDNIYEWIRYKVEDVAANAPAQENADSYEYLYENTFVALKDQVVEAMSGW